MMYALLAQPQRVVLCTCPEWEVLVTSRRYILDSGVVSLHPKIEKTVHELASTGAHVKLQAPPSTDFVILEGTAELDSSRELARLVRGACLLLRRQVFRMKNSYGSACSLSPEDLPLYEQHKPELVSMYVEATGVSSVVAESQLEFDYRAIKHLMLRVKYLEFKYLTSLHTVKTSEQYTAWSDGLLREVHGAVL